MKVTLITGASGGIGKAFAYRLAQEQHNLLLVARTEDKLKNLCEKLSREYNIQAQYIAIDLSKPDSDKIIFEETLKRGVEVDWLINNAGSGSGGDFLEYELDFYKDMMHLNMEALISLCYRFLPQMRSRKSGTIINVSSMAGFGAIPYMGVYAATKNFVRCFTEALWEENRLYDIQTMLLCPGATETGFFDAAKIGADRKNSFSSKSLETPEQVVASAMKGLKNKKVITISGLQNKITKVLTTLFPSLFIVKTLGKMMRKNLIISIK